MSRLLAIFILKNILMHLKSKMICFNVHVRTLELNCKNKCNSSSFGKKSLGLEEGVDPCHLELVLIFLFFYQVRFFSISYPIEYAQHQLKLNVGREAMMVAE